MLKNHPQSDRIVNFNGLLFAMVDVKKIRDQYMPSYIGIRTIATPGDLRQQLKDVTVLLGFYTDESDK